MFNPKMFLSLFLLVFLLVFPSLFAQETITITTYYPSPYGSYGYLHTDKFGVGDNDGSGGPTEADIPITSGNVWIAGNVGIGTTGPNAIGYSKGLTVLGTSDAGIQITGTQTTDIEVGAVEFLNLVSGTNNRIARIEGQRAGSADSGALAFFTLNAGTGLTTTRMFIDKAGNVGIGTAGPSEKLDVNGVARFRQSGGAGGGPIEISDRTSTNSQNIQWNVYYDGTWKYRNSDYGASISFLNTGDLVFYNHALGTAGAAATFRDRMTIKENGNVGIGTANPSSLLHLYGASGADQLRFQDSSTGVGTNLALLTHTAGVFSIALTNSASPTTDQDIQLITNSTSGQVTAMTLKSTGYVGIGTTNPQAKVQVNGVIQLGSSNGAPGTTGVYLGVLIGYCNSGCSYVEGGYLGWDDTTDTLQGADVIGKDDAFDASCYMHSVDNVYCGAIPQNDRYPIIFSVKFN